MAPFPLLNEVELDPVVTYPVDAGEEMAEAVVNAFLAAHIDVFGKPTLLVDWVNADVLEDIRWSADRPLYLCTRVWDHHVVITAGEVRIYPLRRSAGYGSDHARRGIGFERNTHERTALARCVRSPDREAVVWIYNGGRSANTLSFLTLDDNYAVPSIAGSTTSERDLRTAQASPRSRSSLSVPSRRRPE